MEEIEQFIGIEFGDKLRQAIEEQNEKQKDYQREHAVKGTASFGFSDERIAQDFDFVFKRQQVGTL